MRRKLLAVLALLIAVAALARPVDSHAETQLQKIEREIREIQKQMNEAAESKKRAEQDNKVLTAQKEATTEDINKLMEQISQASAQLDATQAKIDAAEERLLRTTEELEKAENQRQNRDEQLQSRIRLIYTNGAVSYLDVLLSSSSFNDFLTRFDALQSIMKQDKQVLVQSEEYKELVADKKAQVEKELKVVKSLYAEMADRKATLEIKERSKEQLVAKLSQQIEETEDISEEAEKALMDFGKKYSQLLEKKNAIKNYYKGGKLGVPLKASYRISSGYGYRTHPVTGQKSSFHQGIDMAAPKGTSVYAAESGVVIVAQSWDSYGNCIIINHGNGLWTVYGHLMPGGILVKKGETVKRGEKIGLVGMTGRATGYHLHFEVRKDGNPVNPNSYLK
ncbi:metalloendopeptidase [Cohnella xylanilytica]|uniref:Peptidoglycan DD-metalloendopeptidase family protein n=1 Tax=Cohnella xylanilytica TaxID=557555 RepID=A0A841TZ47_9BACL|nr:peptidoglycan DD-metalloendopeptidase family protein [Cohnella xylanilytica]MBB6692238.1 peptidoglycan DD-metalloendopeptidase family protein [Cohnella xylanilytica]GIO12318.1 metalloendopeptidase [Cohnella xylanilytica]